MLLDCELKKRNEKRERGRKAEQEVIEVKRKIFTGIVTVVAVIVVVQ